MEDKAMTLAKISDPLFPSLFDNLFARNMMDWSNSNYSNTNTTLPAVNVKETQNEYEIEVAAPGLTKADFNVHLEHNMLTISSEKKDQKVEENGNYTRKEFSYQSFQRSFTIPESQVDGEKIAAKYADGILHVVLPKREEAKPKPPREIKIS